MGGSELYSLSHECRELKEFFPDEEVLYKAIGAAFYQSGERSIKKRQKGQVNKLEELIDVSLHLQEIRKALPGRNEKKYINGLVKELQYSSDVNEQNHYQSIIHQYIQTRGGLLPEALQHIGRILYQSIMSRNVSMFYNKQEENNKPPTPAVINHTKVPTIKGLGGYRISMLRKESKAVDQAIEQLK